MKRLLQFNVFIIGAQKAASSTLHFALMQHPKVCSKQDELAIFEDPFYSKAVVDQTLNQHLRAGEVADLYLLKRPNLLCTDYVPKRLHEYNPQAKLICILREPASRAVSAILHYMKSGLLPVEPIDQAMELVFFTKDSSKFSRIRKLVFEFGMYGKYLKQWLNYFPREQFLFLKQEEMRDLDQAFGRTCDFLDIDRISSLPNLNSAQGKVAVNSLSRLRLTAAVAKSLRRPIGESVYTEWRAPQLLCRSLAHGFTLLDRAVLSKLAKPSDCLVPSPEILARVREFYAADVGQCEELSGLDLSNWQAGHRL
jgi:hypothetical protein